MVYTHLRTCLCSVVNALPVSQARHPPQPYITLQPFKQPRHPLCPLLGTPVRVSPPRASREEPRVLL